MAHQKDCKFQVFELKDEVLFTQLSTSCIFENVGVGRKHAILVDVKNNKSNIPIIRSTTKYQHRPQRFSDVHLQLAEKIQALLSSEKKTECAFNNAMVEIYDDAYSKMGMHSDMTLDLLESSSICLFSCYDNKETTKFRTLRTRNKLSNEISIIPLRHNSIVVFTTETNQKYTHCIELAEKSNDKWLGITFRTSKTIIDPTQLVLADEKQQTEMYKYRGLENSTVDFTWPKEIGRWTLSPGDLLSLKS